jgi:Cupredoxin-like domain
VIRRVCSMALVATMFVAGACSSPSTTSASLPVIIQAPDDPSRPYGIVEIDYHFHDAHPSLPLLPNRTVKWTNEGTVVHNVTFPTIGFSKDLRVEKTFSIEDLGKKLGGPGTYTFYCKYHETLGMVGTIIIVAPGTTPSPSA